MAITRTSRSVEFTAQNDAVTDFLSIAQLMFSGTGLTAGERVIIKDGNDNILVDYVVEAALDNAEFFPNPRDVRGLKVTSAISGTWRITATLK